MEVNVPDVTGTYSDVASEDECKWFYRHMIYSPETDKQIWHWFWYAWRLDNIYTHRQGSLKECSLCARWVLFVMPDSSPPLPLAPCCCWLLPCWQLTAYLALCLEGRALPLSPPPPGVDPISLRSQATPHSSVGYTPLAWTWGNGPTVWDKKMPRAKGSYKSA